MKRIALIAVLGVLGIGVYVAIHGLGATSVSYRTPSGQPLSIPEVHAEQRQEERLIEAWRR